MKPDPLPPPNPDLRAAIVGMWRLVSREDYDREGRRLIDPVLGADPIGLLSFSATHFAAQFSRRGRETEGVAPIAAPAASAPGANNSVASNGYDAYFGTYSVDAAGGSIQTRLEGSVMPANIGLTFTRDARADGKRLWIRLETNSADGVPITRTLTFERG